MSASTGRNEFFSPESTYESTVLKRLIIFLTLSAQYSEMKKRFVAGVEIVVTYTMNGHIHMNAKSINSTF